MRDVFPSGRLAYSSMSANLRDVVLPGRRFGTLFCVRHGRLRELTLGRWGRVIL